MPDSVPGGRPLPLLLGDGWRQVPPRDSGRRLIWDAQGQLYQSGTEFSDIHRLGEVGRVDCPIVVLGKKRQALRYACRDGLQNDYSEFRIFDLVKNEQMEGIRLGLNQWALWLLRYMAQEEVLVALVASHMPGEVLRIQHQLGLFDMKRGKRLLVPLPRDAFMPCDMHMGRREILFSGAEGWQVVNFKGERKAWLRQLVDLPEGRGGSFHPSRPLLALGGRGISLWNRDYGNIQAIHPKGQMPVWHPDGERLFFTESSSDLFVHYHAKGQTERVLAIAGNAHTEITQARSLKLTEDGLFGALPILRRVRRVQGEDGPAFNSHHAIVVLDFQAKELWQYSGQAMNLAWA